MLFDVIPARHTNCHTYQTRHILVEDLPRSCVWEKIHDRLDSEDATCPSPYLERSHIPAAITTPNSDLQLKSRGWAPPSTNTKPKSPVEIKGLGDIPTNTRTKNDPDDQVTSQHLRQAYKTSIIRQPQGTITNATHHPQDRR